jgi:hypothetical protein
VLYMGLRGGSLHEAATVLVEGPMPQDRLESAARAAAEALRGEEALAVKETEPDDREPEDDYDEWARR